jgi:hypothetical protein|tara:strand:+ start:14916 stop:15305 length:390 start_codon:yes stop_codon:yes gene_type:complete
MAYQLQPGMKLVENPVNPPVCATEEVFTYPQPSTPMNRASSRPNTMLYGTAPYMAGKGAPAAFIDTSDELRPQSTTRFNKVFAKTYEQNLFPLQDMKCKLPLRTITYEPESTRADVQNSMFSARYSKRK